MEIIADLELHSKYSRAVSSNMTLKTIAEWADKKGIDLVGSGDFTHPLWLRELESNLEEAGKGVYKLKSQKEGTYPFSEKVRFLLTTEVSCVYSDKGKTRRVHLMIYLPTFQDVKKFNSELTKLGANLFSDGRPIMGLSLLQVAQIALEVNPKALIIPAHVWTPWFGFYGSESGYDSLEEAFGELSKYIYAVETGLSSDPEMNWRIAELENRGIVSFGDAHSPQKLGREATVFELPQVGYENIWRAITLGDQDKASRILYTIEFYPEEGKYHYTGHRKCGVVYSPDEVKRMGLICPVCGKPLTIGVMSRVESLASNSIEVEYEFDGSGVRWIKNKTKQRPKYVMLVPLLEILGESLSLSEGSQKLILLYDHLVKKFGSEFDVLLKTPIDQVEKEAGAKVAEGVKRVRSGEISINPGYDGVFGRVKIWGNNKLSKEIDQETLF